MVLLLTNAICPLPIVPTPVMVSLLVKVPPLPLMKFGPLLPRTRLPPPVRVTVAASIERKVLFPVEPSVIVPALLIELPNTLKDRLLATVRPSAEWLKVRLPTEAEMSSITDAVVVPMVTSTVLPLGTPALQLPALLQWVPSPL